MKADLKGVKNVLQNSVSVSFPRARLREGQRGAMYGTGSLRVALATSRGERFFLGGWVGLHVGQGTGCLDNRSEQGAWWEVCYVALKQKMAQIIFVLLLVDVMVVSYAGGRSGGT